MTRTAPAVLGAVLALAVLAFAWSTVLTFLLGRPLNDMPPWAVFEFMATYGVRGRAGTLLWHSFLIALVGSGALSAPLFFFARPTYYGDARWARWGEIRRARLFDPTGLVLGRTGGRMLRNAEPLHALVAAPTRSGKGVGIVIPNLLLWPDSCVVLDIKHEIYAVTAGARSHAGELVFQWAPMEARSHRYNPFDFLAPQGPRRISDLQLLATLLLPHAPRSDPMWTNEARDLFLGLALLVLDDPQVPHTIGQVYRTLKRETDLAEIAQLALEQPAAALDPAARQSLANFKNKAAKEQSGVKSTLTAALGLWANPQIDAATAASDFDLRTLRFHRASVYVGVAQDQLLTLAPLLNLFFQQAVAVLSRALPTEAERHAVLFMIDEFAMLGAMPGLAKGLALLAGYNIRLVLITQGLGQLKDLYGPAGMEGILQNCAIQVFFASNDESTTNYVSARLGTKTVQVRSRSQSQDWRTTTATSYVPRPLLPPEEVRRLDGGQAILFKEGARPVRARKLRYFSDRTFAPLLLPAPPVPVLDVPPPPPDPAERAALELARLVETTAETEPEQAGHGAPAPAEIEAVFHRFGEEGCE